MVTAAYGCASRTTAMLLNDRACIPEWMVDVPCYEAYDGLMYALPNRLAKQSQLQPGCGQQLVSSLRKGSS